MSVTIEGIFREIFKTFVDDPLKTSFKSPVIVEEVKFILIIFYKYLTISSNDFVSECLGLGAALSDG